MHSFVVKDLFEFIKSNPLPTAKNPPMTEPTLYQLACGLLELRDRVVALEAAGSVAGNPGHAPTGVTIHELTRAMERFGCDSAHAEFLWNDPRIGPLLRGEGAAAPVRVALVEEALPSDGGYEEGTMWFGHPLRRYAPRVARAEVERQQQGGQADG